MLVPHLLEEVLSAEEGGSVPHEDFEHAELFHRQLQRAAVAGGGVPQGVEFYAGGAEYPGPGGGLAAGQGGRPCRVPAASSPPG